MIRAKGLTYEKLGEIVGLTKTSIARIASGTQTPSFDTLKVIADALDVDIRDLFRSTKNSQDLYIKGKGGELIKVGELNI